MTRAAGVGLALAVVAGAAAAAALLARPAPPPGPPAARAPAPAPSPTTAELTARLEGFAALDLRTPEHRVRGRALRDAFADALEAKRPRAPGPDLAHLATFPLLLRGLDVMDAALFAAADLEAARSDERREQLSFDLSVHEGELASLAREVAAHERALGP